MTGSKDMQSSWCIARSPVLARKTLRIIAFIIAAYQLVISHTLLFMVFIGLMHAKEVHKMLLADIEEDREINEYTAMPDVYAVSRNEMRFKTAQELTKYTLTVLYVALVLSATYVLSCIILLKGVMKNNPCMMCPWLLLKGFSTVILFLFWIFGKIQCHLPLNLSAIYESTFMALYLLDMIILLFVRQYYIYAKQDRKLANELIESATVKIPIHDKEKIIEGNDGYTHHIHTAADPILVPVK
ncbi:uncharacterized protein LOC132259446 [Phlebotomus argentipes]|uniref:uncharacterized protein LOC132259446 n=1 Tax=Phlebotomus argentipes TaxID=94469 RepID=UPI00289341F4|nr:uncharacterized protein LOC132259446 [Phlebotomus argentipes]